MWVFWVAQIEVMPKLINCVNADLCKSKQHKEKLLLHIKFCKVACLPRYLVHFL